MWYVYLILCKDKSLYTGITNDLEKRFRQHKNGKGGRYTRSHEVVKILHSEEFKTRSKALKRETEIKSWPWERKLELIKAGHPN